MKAVSQRIRVDGVTYFQFLLIDGKQFSASRYAVTGRAWKAIISGLKKNEFRDIDQLDSVISALSAIVYIADGEQRKSGFVIKKEVNS